MNERQKAALPDDSYVIWKYIPGSFGVSREQANDVTIIDAEGIKQGFFGVTSLRYEADDSKGYRTASETWFKVEKQASWHELEAKPELLKEHPINGYSIEQMPHAIRKAFILAQRRAGEMVNASWVLAPECPNDMEENPPWIWVSDENEVPGGFLRWDELCEL